MTKLLITLSIIISLSACKSVGTQYKSPEETEPHATITTQQENVLLTSFDEKGCYSGRTHIAPGAIFNLSPDKETFITYESTMCNLVLSFTPQKDEQYVFMVKVLGEYRRRPTYCVANINKITTEGLTEPVNITQFNMRQKRLTCIKAIPVRK